MKTCRDFLGRDISGTTFLRAESSLIQSNCRSLRNLKSLLPSRKKNVCQYVRRDLINLKISISVKQANKITFITHGFRVSVVSDVRERVRDLGSPLPFMLRRSSLVECVSMLHRTCLQCTDCFFYP
jgi:hypothetical protein